ncbi:MAG: LysM peptidoglycan-binding domain-containing protein [Cyclobacteriaceae bacterium]|nr:LysM peptidoglycan-binding domain-containing protein [Cyclobacteriaceae bacterium]
MIVRFFYLALGCLLLLVSVANATHLDSIGAEVINGKVYVLYQVESGESVYSIATKYGISMRDIVAVSPEVKKGLQIGMVIKVPYKRAQKIASKTNTNYHIVKSGETLYGISRLYQVSVNQLMGWNSLKSTGLHIGQKLFITGNTKVVEPPKVVSEKGNKIHIVTQGEGLYGIARIYNIKVDDIIQWNQLQSTSLQVDQRLIIGINAGGNYVHPTKLDTAQVSLSRRYEIEKVIESGIASTIEGSGNTIKYLALHRTAKIGAIIAIKNEMNDQMVFVRVIGKLPNTGINSKIVIRISDAAYKKLGAIDSKFRVQLSYLPNR